GVAEGRIANAPMKAFPPVGTEALVAEIGVEAAPVALDVRVAIVVEEQIDLEDSSQDVVDLDAIDLVHGEVVLLAVELALACEVVLDAVPALQQSLEQESAGARRGVDDVVAPVDVESGHGEARDLAHREVLAQLAPEHRPEEPLEGPPDGVGVGVDDADVLQHLDDGPHLLVRQLNADAFGEDGLVLLAGFGEELVDAVGDSSRRLPRSHLEPPWLPVGGSPLV